MPCQSPKRQGGAIDLNTPPCMGYEECKLLNIILSQHKTKRNMKGAIL